MKSHTTTLFPIKTVFICRLYIIHGSCPGVRQQRTWRRPHGTWLFLPTFICGTVKELTSWRGGDKSQSNSSLCLSTQECTADPSQGRRVARMSNGKVTVSPAPFLHYGLSTVGHNALWIQNGG